MQNWSSLPSLQGAINKDSRVRIIRTGGPFWTDCVFDNLIWIYEGLPLYLMVSSAIINNRFIKLGTNIYPI